ncbi:MAG: Gfo/Idh/MocA family oxidoreductase [Anaerolineae bacterium]
MDAQVKVGIIGAGNIAPAYIKGCRGFDILEVAAIADLDSTKAEARAEEFGLKAMSIAELLADPDIQIVINLTIPRAHAEVDLLILEAGKHVYSEKPLGVTREEGARVLEKAAQAGLRVGCAPDTFLGGGLQTVRKLLDDGAIGDPVAAMAFLTGRGPESWHPNPDFFYKFGGGPMLDMGPYYITALVVLLGAVRRVSALTRITFPERIATSPALHGHKIAVEVPTHYSGSLEFASGAIVTMVTSFDIYAANLPRIEIHGSAGSISVPDPNHFVGPVRLWTPDQREWCDVPLTHDDTVLRGIGVADMAYGIHFGRPHRASGDLAFHVLDVMQAFEESSAAGQAVTLQTQPERPAALPVGLAPRMLDA